METKVTVSPYMALNSWLHDNSLDTKVPEVCLNGIIVQTIILNYFYTSPKYFVFINKLFNNFDLFSLSLEDIFKTMKQIVYYTNYKPPFVSKAVKDNENKLCGMLKKKFPYYRKEEISMVVDIIDNDQELQDVIYEQFDIRKATKRKMNSKEFKKRLKNITTAQSLIDSL